MASKPILDWGDPVQDVAGLRPAPPPIPQTGFVENFAASRREMEIAGNTNAQTVNMSEAYAPLVDALEKVGARQPNGGHFLNPGTLPDGETVAYGTSVPGRDQMRQMIFDEIKRRRTVDKTFLSDVPDNPDAFDSKTLQRNSERLQEIRQTQAGASGLGRLGGFVGGVAGSFEDPVNLWTMPIGGGSKTIAGAIGRAAVENALLEAVSQPKVRQNYAALGESMTLGDSVRSVIFSGGAGALFRGGGEAIAHAGPLYDHFVKSVFDALPEGVRQKWASGATIDDKLLVDTLRQTVPEDHWTPNLRSAVNVLERDAEIRDASPFKPGVAGDDLHGQSLSGGIQAMTNPLSLRAEALSTASPAATVSRVVPAPHEIDRGWSAIVGNEGGTDRHGNFLTSPKGAIGPAQVMPGTAPYAARLAGLPWDEQRYRTDRDYNLAIGRAYYQEQLRTFGDPEKAAAAYNAGPGSTAKGTGLRGAMDRAAKAGEPDNWRAYLPHETQQYVKDFRRRAGGAEPVSASEPEIRTASAEPDTTAQMAEMEALGLRRQNLSDVSAEMGRETVEPAVVPELRREIFPDEASYIQAQVDLHRVVNEPDVPQAPAGRPSGVETGSEGLGVARDGEGAVARPVAPETLDQIGADAGERGVHLVMDEHPNKIMLHMIDTSPAGRGQGLGTEFMQRIARYADSAGKRIELTPDASVGASSRGRLVKFYKRFDFAENKGRSKDFSTQAGMIREPQALAQATSERTNSLARTASWVLRNKHTGEVVMETFDRAKVDALNTAKYEAVPIGEYLGGLGSNTERGRFDSPPALDGGAAPQRIALERFSDPAGEGVRIAADSIEHDLRTDLAANPALAAKSYLIDQVGVQSLNDILGDLDSEKAAVDALRGCL